MKHFKKIMALVIAMAMVIAMGLPVMAADPPTSGSITVNSPIVGAEYTAYKVFEMTTNGDVNSFSYTLKGDNPFFDTVMAYANMPAAGATTADPNTDGLTLKVTADTADKPKAQQVYTVEVTSAFDPQAFGQELLKALKGTPAVEADPTADPPVEGQPAVAPIDASAVAETPIAVTVANSNHITFDGLDLGYFLITSEYPKAEFSSVTMTEKKYDGTDKADPAVKHVYDKNSLVDPTATDLALTPEAIADIDQYVENVVDDAYVEAYIADKGLKDKDANDNDIDIVNPSTRFTEVKNELIASMKADAKAKVLAALKNQIEASESDINLAKEPILVFLDSSQPVATINEKNEIPKWDTPLNPSGDALPENLPDHGEPDGGKNIVITPDGVTPVVYADWSEANIGDDIHYQLRINAMNFVRDTAEGAPATQATADQVKQVKEYFLADYQNEHMTWKDSKYLRVTVVDGNGTPVTKNADGEVVDYLDYTNAVKADNTIFFKNYEGTTSTTTDVLSTGTGIMVPWVKVVKNPSDTELATLKGKFPVYTTSEVDTGTFDSNQEKIIDKYYVFSLYNSDVTIVVDYYMTLNDDAVIDGDGNPNYAQYGYSTVEPKDTEPTPPDDKDKPDKKKEVDDATVYTYALAFVKIDDKGEALADAKFELPFYVKKAKASDGSYVYAFDTVPASFAAGDSAENYTNTLTTPANGVITIKGVTAGTYSITETEAPEGYNKMTEPFDVEAKKTGEEVITTTTKTIYLDAQGNVVDEQSATTTVTKHTSDGNLPVYQFMPIVNKKGTELPSTGGIGTTIFYVIGAILVIGAGVVLVTRRRMDV